MALTASLKYKLKRFVKELGSVRARHTELISVYIPTGYDIIKVINHLYEEKGTATNIKSTSTRKNVTDALEKMIQHLKLYKKTPENGLAAFSGNVAEREGQVDMKVWSIEPPVPLNTRIYRCDKTFVIDILENIMEVKEVYGLVVMDGRDATLALLKGKTIIPIRKTHSEVPGKMKAGGQCLVKDSLVQLSGGSLTRIEIVHNPHVVKSVMIKDNFAIQNSNITDKWNVKKNQVYKIITKNPRLEVQSSGDHVFFVSTEKGIIEKTAKELKEGDTLLTPEKIDIKGKLQKLNSKQYYNSFIINKEGRKSLKQKREFKKLLQSQLAKKIGLAHQMSISVFETGKQNIKPLHLRKLCRELGVNFEEFLDKYTTPYKYRDVKLPNTLNEEFAQFLGYFVGDGCIETDRITFFEQNKQVALAYQKKFNKFFNLNSSYRFREKKNYHQLRFTSRPLVRFIKEQFPEIKKTLDSEIPQKILESPNHVLASFLRGLFDAEGYPSKNERVGLGLNNKRLVQQLQMTLLRFGIISSFLEYDNKGNPYSDNPRFTLEISEKESLRLFRNNIGFISLEKAKKLNSIINKKSDTSHVRQIVIPGKEIRKIIEKAGYNLELFPKVNSFFRNERMMSKQAFKSSILANIKNKKLYCELKEICDYPILPVQINKIEIANKPTKMIDISVKNQNFIVNGLIAHNSAPRFARLREGALKDHYKKIAEYMKEEFLHLKNLKGIIVGGPSTTVTLFLNKGYITGDLQKKIIGTKDLSYTGEFGLQELLDRSADILSAEEVAGEKEIMQKFLTYLAKEPGKVTYGEESVMKALGMGAVDVLLVSEESGDDKIESLEEEAKKTGTEVKIISVETREGVQLRDLGKIAAILRYSME